MEKSNERGKLIVSVLAGVVAGAALGVLFAPGKGRKTRKRLLSSVKGLAEDVKQKVKEEVNALRTRAGELELVAEEKMQDVVNGIHKEVDIIKHKA